MHGQPERAESWLGARQPDYLLRLLAGLVVLLYPLAAEHIGQRGAGRPGVHSGRRLLGSDRYLVRSLTRETDRRFDFGSDYLPPPRVLADSPGTGTAACQDDRMGSSIAVRRLDLGYFVRPASETGGPQPRVEPVLAYLVQRDEGLILFDTGIGAADPETEAHYRPQRRALEGALAARESPSRMSPWS